MRMWLDSIRECPEDYTHHAYSVNDAKMMIMKAERNGEGVECIDCDYDLGKFALHGGNGICLLDWLAKRETFYNVKIHTTNSVGRKNMESVIRDFWQ